MLDIYVWEGGEASLATGGSILWTFFFLFSDTVGSVLEERRFDGLKLSVCACGWLLDDRGVEPWWRVVAHWKPWDELDFSEALEKQAKILEILWQ
jgi:hypothetical protein